MNSRKLGLIAGLIGLIFIPRISSAQGVIHTEVTPVQESEGRDPIVFASTCTAGYWNIVRSSDVIAYSILMVAIDSNTAPICLVPTVTSSSATSLSGASYSGCFPYTPGSELPARNSSLTDYSKAAWWCRSQAGTQFIKGYWTRDRGDWGKVSNPGLQ